VLAVVPDRRPLDRPAPVDQHRRERDPDDQPEHADRDRDIDVEHPVVLVTVVDERR
jgi:hypothetical protein